jgi:hypothetical protein
MARGQDFTMSRMVCGVHYRSDTTAAQTIAMMVVQAVFHDAIMTAGFQNAPETRRFSGSPVCRRPPAGLGCENKSGIIRVSKIAFA